MQISLLGAVQKVQEDEITEGRCLLKSQKSIRYFLDEQVLITTTMPLKSYI